MHADVAYACLCWGRDGVIYSLDGADPLDFRGSGPWMVCSCILHSWCFLLLFSLLEIDVYRSFV